MKAIEEARTGEEQDELIQEIKEIDDYNDFSDRCEAHGVFTNMNTLEVDVFRDEDFTAAVIETHSGNKASVQSARGWVNQWEAKPEALNSENYLKLIEAVGKGRFAQRLASRIEGVAPPTCITGAVFGMSCTARAIPTAS